MTHTYHISGMTCNGCVAKVKTALLKIGDITSAEVQLTAPQAAITMQKHIPLQQLQSAISATGAFTITEADGGMHSHTVSETNGKTWLQTYKPLLLVFFYLVLVTSGLYFSGIVSLIIIGLALTSKLIRATTVKTRLETMQRILRRH